MCFGMSSLLYSAVLLCGCMKKGSWTVSALVHYWAELPQESTFNFIAFLIHLVHSFPLRVALKGITVATTTHTYQAPSQQTWGLVRSHTDAQTSVWGWFSDKMSPVTHTEMSKVQSSLNSEAQPSLTCSAESSAGRRKFHWKKALVFIKYLEGCYIFAYSGH